MNAVKKALKKYNDMSVVAKATLWFIFVSTLQRGLAGITTPIFTRMMTTEQYGQYNAYNSWLQIFTIITTLRLNWAVFSKGMSKYKEDRDGYTSTMQTLTLLITALVFGIYLIFHVKINELTELPTFIMVAMFAELAVSPAIDFWSLRKRYEYEYRPVVIRTVAVSIINTLVGILAVYLSEEKGYARILTCILVDFCFGMFLFAYNRKRAKTWFKKEYAVFAITFVLPLLLHYFSQYVLDQFDRIMIQKMVDLSAVGIYGVAYSAGMIIKVVSHSVNNAIVPWQYDRLEKKEIKDLDNALFMIYVFVSACVLLIVAFSPELTFYLGDAEYSEAKYIIPPVAMGLFFSFMYTTIANVEFFYDQTKFTMLISMSGAALNIVLNYFGIKAFGYIAAAYTTLICYIYFAVAHYIYTTHCVKKELGIKKVFSSGRIVIVSAIMLAAGMGLITLFDFYIVRYIVIAVILIIMFINRKRITSMFKNIRSVKKKDSAKEE